MSTPGQAVSAVQLGVLVLNFLEGGSFARSAKAFKREAKQAYGEALAVPPGVKSLEAIICEYIVLKDAELRRTQAFLANPALRDVFAVIEHHAGVVPADHHLQPAAAGDESDHAAHAADDEGAGDVQPGLEPGLRQQPAAEQTGAADGHGAPSMLPQDAGGPGAGGEIPAIAERVDPAAAAAGPGRGGAMFSPGCGKAGHRKGAPRRKAISTTHPALVEAPVQGAAAGAVRLLDRQVDLEALQSLLAGEWQERFAELLARHISGWLAGGGAAPPPLVPESGAATTDDAEMMDWIAAMTADPSLTSLLEPIVAPPSGVFTSTAAEPAHHPARAATGGGTDHSTGDAMSVGSEAFASRHEHLALLLDAGGDPAGAPHPPPTAPAAVPSEPELRPAPAPGGAAAAGLAAEVLPGGIALDDFLDGLDYGD